MMVLMTDARAKFSSDFTGDEGRRIVDATGMHMGQISLANQRLR